MAASFVRSASVFQGTATGSQNLAIDGTATNGMLVVETRTYDGGTVTALTYNGDAFTQVGGDQTLGSDQIKLWVLPAPDAGTNNITATISPDRRIEMYAVLLQDAAQTVVVDATQWSTGTSTSATGAIVTTVDNCFCVAFTEGNGTSGSPTSSTNCTVASPISDRGAGGHGGPKTPAGSFTQALGWPGSGQWSFFQVAIAPYVAPVGPGTLESWDTVAKASIETMNTVALANIESWNTVA